MLSLVGALEQQTSNSTRNESTRQVLRPGMIEAAKLWARREVMTFNFTIATNNNTLNTKINRQNESGNRETCEQRREQASGRGMRSEARGGIERIELKATQKPDPIAACSHSNVIARLHASPRALPLSQASFNASSIAPKESHQPTQPPTSRLDSNLLRMLSRLVNLSVAAPHPTAAMRSMHANIFQRAAKASRCTAQLSNAAASCAIARHFYIAPTSHRIHAKQSARSTISPRQILAPSQPRRFMQIGRIKPQPQGSTAQQPGWVNPENKVPGEELAKYCLDLTQQAREGKLDAVIGRDQETLRVIEILSRRRKNNPIVIGEAGVGKRKLKHNAAQRAT